MCAIIDAFHFATELPEEPAQAAIPAEAAPPAETAPQPLGLVPKDAAYVADIQKALAKRVLPALQKQLVHHLITYSIWLTLLSIPSIFQIDLPPLRPCTHLRQSINDHAMYSG